MDVWSWIGAATLAGTLLAGVDAALTGIAALAVLHASGLGAATGLLFGLPWALCFRPLRDGKRWIAGLFWPLLSLICAVLLADALGAFERVSGPHARLAWMVLGGCGAGALGMSALALAAQPWPGRPRGYLGQHLRWPAVALAALSAAALVFADRRLFVGLYDPAHLALQGAALWLLTLALWLAIATRRAWWLATLVAAPLLWLSASDASALQDAPLARRALLTLRQVTDFDLDGYSGWLGGGDCAPLDGSSHPGAREVPGNGIDENCRLGDAAIYDTGSAPPPVPPDASPMSVALITIDTVRPDHLGLYGYRRDTTPHLSRFAATALRYDRAYTSGAWTSLAVPSLFRGVYPRRLRWTRLFETTRYRLLRTAELDGLLPGERIRFMYTMPLDTPRKPLAWWLRRRGMHTAAVVDDGYSQFLGPNLGAADGFDAFHEVDDLPKKRRTDRGTADLAIRAIDALPPDRPFLLFFLFFGPHDPNTRHKGLPRYGKSQADRYDHELRYADLQVSRVLDRLAEVETPLATFVTSDHGELFIGKRRYHGVDLHEQGVRIPLLARVPGWPTGTTDRLVSLVDLAPTVLALTETPTPYRMDGVDLATPPPPDRVLLAETWRYRRDGPPRQDLIAAFDGERKLVFDTLRNRRRLVDQAELRRPARDLLPTGESAPALTDAVFRYLEQTGGRLHLED